MKTGEVKVNIVADTTELQRQMRAATRTIRAYHRLNVRYLDAMERSFRRARRLHRSRISWYWWRWYSLVDWLRRRRTA